MKKFWKLKTNTNLFDGRGKMYRIRKGKKVTAVVTKKQLKKEIKIEYLYLDLNTCDRCIGTDTVLEQVIRELTPAFALAGYRISYKKTEIETEQDAIVNQFVSSPTIRINGCDICTDIKESDCGCCGEIAGVQVDCRTFEYEGRLYTIPPKEMLADAILKKAFSSEEVKSSVEYELPQNLKNFFAGKEKKKSCCSCSCC